MAKTNIKTNERKFKEITLFNIYDFLSKKRSKANHRLDLKSKPSRSVTHRSQSNNLDN